MAKKVKLNIPVVALREYIAWATINLIQPQNAYELMHMQILQQIHDKAWDYNNEKKGCISLTGLELTALRILMYRWDFFSAPEYLIPSLAIIHNSLPKLAVWPDAQVLLPPPTENFYEDDE